MGIPKSPSGVVGALERSASYSRFDPLFRPANVPMRRALSPRAAPLARAPALGHRSGRAPRSFPPRWLHRDRITPPRVPSQKTSCLVVAEAAHVDGAAPGAAYAVAAAA